MLPNKKISFEEWVDRAILKFGNKFVYHKEDFIDSNSPIRIYCPEHGEFKQSLRNHLKTVAGCPKCGYKKCGDNHHKTTEQFIEEARKVHGNKYNYDKVNYTYNNVKVLITCPIHGDFYQIPTNHLSGKGCSECGKLKISLKISKNTEYFINKAKLIHGDKYDYSKTVYTRNDEKVCIICHEKDENGIEHGEFWQTPNNHTNGTKAKGCPKCKLKSQTKLFEKLKESFPNKEILFEVGKEKISWLGLQRFDIYFPKYNIAIEYNGIQHYIPVEHFGGELKFQSQLEYDELKRQKCKENNCTLFEVKYDYTEEDYNELVKNIQKIIN